MPSAQRSICLSLLALLGTVRFATGQQPATPPGILRAAVMKRQLPVGDFRTVEVVVLDLAPAAGAPIHRHDVAVVAYVLAGEVENRFNGGPPERHVEGQSWWEAPGTVHNVARNVSATARARLLIVYVAESGKANTVPIP